MNKGKRPALTGEEIVTDIVSNKERQMSRSRGNGLYPRERSEVVDETITRLVGMNFEQMSQFATSENISLSDIGEVKKRTLIYLKACEEHAVFPSVLGLSRALGYSRNELNNWMTKHQGTDTSRWLRSFADACAETLHQAALTKHASEITTIFLSKALYGMTETQTVVFTPGTNETDREVNEDALRAEYEQYLRENDTETYNRIIGESETNENENENV